MSPAFVHSMSPNIPAGGSAISPKQAAQPKGTQNPSFKDFDGQKAQP
jgi:hypothetical protein